jgi:hypothetical protein
LAEERERELKKAKEEGKDFVEVSDEDLIKYKESIIEQKKQDEDLIQQESE